MSDLVVLEDDLNDQIDWDQLFSDNPPEIDDSIFFNDIDFSDVSADNQLSTPPPDGQLTFTVDEIEQLMMNDDDIVRAADESAVPDFLLDSPGESDGSRGDVVDLSDGGQKASSLEVENNNNNTDDGEEDDPVSKKRRRQERNRDAAVRSRERKKLYVRDLEMKSRYFEGECKRLGLMLNCVMAENQALHLSLQSSKAFDASKTKQESAVLFLESLLLGSLLWFLAITCLVILPEPLRSTQEEYMDNRNRESLAPRKAGSKIFELEVVYESFIMGKRCKASRSRMKDEIKFPYTRSFGVTCRI